MATIIIKNSTGSGVTPSSLQQGELAINVVDGKLFYGSGSGDIAKEFTGSGGTAFPYTGSARITGSLDVIGTTTLTGSLTISGSSTFTNIGPAVFSGSVDSQGGFTGSLQGTASFASTASYLSDLNQNLTLTGNLNITGNLSVLGTASFVYTTQSIINVGSGFINLNTDYPAARFGGINVIDSGSFGNSSTGSLLWDSLNNRWIYSNPSGSTYDGGMLISGPRNTSGVGNEVGTTLNALMKGQGGDHITSSGIFEDASGSVSIGIVTASAKLDLITSANRYALRLGQNTANADGSWTGIKFQLSTNTANTDTQDGQVSIRANRFTAGNQLQILNGSTIVGTFGGISSSLLLGTTIDSGYKLDVSGSIRFKGAGSTSATTALRVESLNTSSSLTVLNNGNTIITGSITLTSGISASAGALGNGIEIYGRNLNSFANNPGLITFWAGDSSFVTSSTVGITFGNQNSGNHRAAIVYESTARSLNFYTNTLNLAGVIDSGRNWVIASSATNAVSKLHVRSDGTSSNATKAFHVENTSSNALFVVLDNGFVGINTSSAQFNLDVSGSGRFRGNIIITSSAVIGSSSLGPFENTLTLGARDTGAEGGQLGLNAPGGTYTSASFIDNWQNQFRILRGDNTTSDVTVASWNMHTKQMTLSAYNNAAAFTGSSVALLAVDSNGNIITNGRLSTYRSSGTGSMVGTGTTSLTATTSFLIPANTFTTGDILRVRYRVRKLATNANTTTGIYINTTNDISTATTLGILTANTTLMQMKRDFYILAATGINTEHAGVGTSLATDDAATGRAASTINWAVDQYIIFGITHTNTSDSGYSTMYYLERV